MPALDCGHTAVVIMCCDQSLGELTFSKFICDSYVSNNAQIEVVPREMALQLFKNNLKCERERAFSKSLNGCYFDLLAAVNNCPIKS